MTARSELDEQGFRMSIPVLIEVYDEMRRLAIAGSAVAAGDFRLKKLVPPLEKSGEKAPVFAKVAQAVQAVVDSNEKTASGALLELTTLVNAILYTQGETGIAGELKPLETTDLGGHSTQASARVLKPLLEALSSTGSGRMELVKDAYERGTFKDLRLIKPALAGLDDPYSEIADFIADKVLPVYGNAILPELRAKLDIKGRGGHLHRLRLMHRLDPQGSREVVQAALNDGSKEMRMAAIECLGKSEDDLVYLLEQSRSKAKDVRAAALRALAKAGTSSANVIAALKKAIAGPDLEMIVERVKECPLPEVQDYVLEQAEQQLAELLKTKDKKRQGEIVSHLRELVSCLEDRTDVKAEAFLLKCFDHAAALGAVKSLPSGADLNEWVAHVLAKGTPKMQKRLVESHKTLTGGMLPPALYAARATMTPAKFYEEFSPLLKALAEKKGKKGPERERAEALLGVLTAEDANYRHFAYRRWIAYGEGGGEEESKSKKLPALDPRWLDAAVDAGSVELVCELARPGHAKTNKYLSDQLAAAKKPHDAKEVLRTMVRIRHPDAADGLIDSLKKLAKESHFHYLGYWYGPMIVDLPKGAVPKVEEALATLPEKMVDNLMESVVALKNKTE